MRVREIFKSILPVMAFTGAGIYYDGTKLAHSISPAAEAPVTEEADQTKPKFLRYEKVITEDILRKDLTFLASDENRGRQAGEKILETRVTDYLENIFRDLGLERPFNNGTSYRQPFIIDLEDIPWEEGKFDKKPLKTDNKPRMKALSWRDREVRLYPAFPEGGLGRRPVKTHNLAAILVGSDEKLKNQCVVVSGHYDHVGIDQLAEPEEDFIYNGADDNASGVSVVLAIARALTQAKSEGHGPKRSVIFLLPSAEEWGQLGSEFFTNNPPVPMEQIFANVNFDMIGRRPKPTVISVLDSDNDGTPYFFHNFHDDLLDGTGIEQVLHNIELGRQRSDQWQFMKKGKPVVLISEGLVTKIDDKGKTHEDLHDDYHRVTDEVDKINFSELLQAARFSFRVVWKALNKEDLNERVQHNLD